MYICIYVCDYICNNNINKFTITTILCIYIYIITVCIYICDYICKIRGPDNPTSQLLPISRNKSCSGTEKEGKTNEVVDDPEAKKSCM